jgi:hypothetical protein
MLTYAQCKDLVASSRDKNSKPVANNTRVERRGDSAYALRLHATDIATYWENGTIEINSGGWQTVTTAQRLNAFVTRHVYSERGTWFVRCEPNEKDPEPLRGDRSVPKPFHALDPGPEPVRDDSSPEHVAGTVVATPYEREKLVTKREVEPGNPTGWTEDDIVRPYDRQVSDYFAGYVMQRGFDVVAFGERSYAWGDEANWRERIDNEFGTLSINDNAEYKQCPHCNLFDRQHAAWYQAMHGVGYGRSQRTGYKQMCEQLEKHGSREAWQDAYLDDFRTAREQRAAHKAWIERNRVLFEDHMAITAEGYAPNPNSKEQKRLARAERKLAKQRKRIDTFVANAVDELVEKTVPMPSGGDCWGCVMRSTEDSSMEVWGIDHLEQHIEEDYYVPSMFVNAMRNSGYRDAGIYIMLNMNPHAGTMGGEQTERATITRALRKYLYKKLEIAHAVR